MLQSANKVLKPILVLSVAALLVGLIGCSQFPTNVDVENPDDTRLLTRRMSAAKPTGDSMYAEIIMPAAEGGTLVLLDIELTIPANALDSDTLISIKIPDISIFENHFGTDGLVFNDPVRIVMSYRDADLTNVDESTIKMAWFDNETNSWDEIECELDRVNRTVTADVRHFSAYALISD